MSGITPEDWLKYGAMGANTLTLVMCLGLLRWSLGRTFKYVEGMLKALKNVEVALARIESKLGIDNESDTED